MPTALDVADFFIEHEKNSDDPMTNMRVNKYVYLAQGYSLAKLGKPLFDDQIQAWDYGPVVPALYHLFKSDVKAEPILSPVTELTSGVFSREQIDILTQVMIDYGRYSTGQISSMTHERGSPWYRAYVKGANNPISQEDMARYFSGIVGKSVIERAMEEPLPGYVDENNHMILPMDFDDEDD